MSRLSQLAVSQRSVTILLAFALFVAGISAWGSLKQELLPDIDFPVITVVAPYPGAGATDVAEQVAKPIETAIQGVPRLESLRSTSANSVALVVAQFSFGTNVKETQAAIDQNIRALGLPQSVTPTVAALNINASPVVIASIAATSEDGLQSVAQIANDEIVPAIQSIDGVATVDLTGSLEPQVTVTLDPQKLADAGVSVQQILGVLQANNITVPSGQLESDGTRIPVSTEGKLTSVDQIAGLIVGAKQPVTAPGATPAPGQLPTPVLLKDVATVQLESVATTGYARTDGNPSLTLVVTKTSSANTVLVAQAVEKALSDAQAAHPGDLTVTTVQNLSNFILESQDGLLREGGLGALFAIITIFLFLFNLRSTLVAAISIPLSVLTGLVLMQVAGLTLNVMTLGGLAVAVGRVVDDAIVVLENIYRHRALGEDKLTAVTNGPREVARAITASTLTTILVFLPIGFVGGIVSQLFLPFALTVTFALAASLVVALTVVPVLAYLFIDKVKLNVDEDGEPKNSFWIRTYTPAIKFVLRSRLTKWATLGVAAALFVGLAGARRQPAHPVHQCRLREDPRRYARAAGGRLFAGRPRRRHRRRAHPDGPAQRRAGPNQRARRQRHELPDHHRRAAGPARQLGQHDHSPRAQRRPRRGGRSAFRRARSDQRTGLPDLGCPNRRLHQQQLEHHRQRRRSGRRQAGDRCRDGHHQRPHGHRQPEE